MANFTMIKSKKIIFTALGILFWVFVWEIISILVDNAYFMPGFFETVKVLFGMLDGKSFYLRILFTALRVIAGLFIGVFLGVLLAIFSHKFMFVKNLISPLITIIKSTPVASLIILFWVALDGNSLSVLIAILMVMPIIWQNLLDSFSSVDKNLVEVCDVFGFSYKKRIKLLYLPTMLKFFIPSLITATGLAWKAEIAAEIIVSTKTSIGQAINDAKYNFDSPKVFAWTLVIIIFSICLEKTTRYLLARVDKKEEV